METKYTKVQNEDGTVTLKKIENLDTDKLAYQPGYYVTSSFDDILDDIDKVKEKVDKIEKEKKKILWKTGNKRYGRRRYNG